MRYLPVSEVEEGMVLGRTVYDAAGAALLNAGTNLTSYYIERLKELGYPALYIRSPLDPRESTFLEPIRRETIAKAKTALNEIAAGSDSGTVSPAVLKRVSFVVGELIDELLSNRDLVLNVVEIRSHDGYTFDHSVSVAILSIMAGVTLGLGRSELTDLGIGAMLHDIGKIFMPTELLNKPDALTDAEFDQVKAHTVRGYHVLREQISLLSAHVAYQHHERCDGSGYPRGLKRSDILQFAKIVAVADSYDAMTADRPDRPGLFHGEAALALLQESPEKYDPECVKAVLRNVAPFPIGSLVLLNTGETGEVAGATRDETSILINQGPRRGQIVSSPADVKIERRVGWGKWA